MKQNSNHQSLSALILDYLRSSKNRAGFTGLTLGIEHEFFLFSGDRTANLEESQEFLLRLSSLREWRRYDGSGDSPGDPVIRRASREFTGGRYSTVKYEFPPHMLELATTYHSSVEDLREDLEICWFAIFSAAKDVGLRVVSEAIISPPNISASSQEKIDKKYLTLSAARKRLIEERGENASEHYVDFPSFLAATQVQIGGTEWWERGGTLVDSLYRMESMLADYSFLLCTNGELDGARALRKRRWNLYKGVFGEMPLLGFPKVETWNLDNWAKCLNSSQLIEKGDAAFLCLEDYRKVYSNIDAAIALSLVRDLQAIRPKLTGTLEFRGDPAMPNVECMISLAVFRLGCVIIAEKIRPSFESLSFSKCREYWWNPDLNSIEIEKHYSQLIEAMKNESTKISVFLRDPLART